MAQVLNPTPHSGVNYAPGGIRAMISEIASGVVRRGFVPLGVIRDPKWTNEIEYYEHVDASSGVEVKDYEVAVKTASKFSFQADEMFCRNFERFFLAADAEDVAANAAATNGPDLIIAGKTGDLHGLDEGRQTDAQRALVTVYNVTDSALLVEDTDYEVVKIFGWTYIKMLVDTYAGDTLRIGTGVTAATAYAFNKLAHKLIKPLSLLRREVRAIIQGPSKTGVNWEWKLERGLLKPAGDFNWVAKEVSSMAFEFEALDNSANEPDYPWGKMRFYGYNDSGAQII